MTVVSAPAGYGKSTLAADWAADSKYPYAWLTLDRSHRDPRVLVRDLARATAFVFPEAIDDFLRHIERPTSDVDRSAFADAFVGLVHELLTALERVGRRFALVIDDAHVVRDSEAREPLAALLRRPPKNATVVLLTRAWDVTPDIARLVADGQASVLLEQDLAFDDAEAARLLRRSGIRDHATIQGLTRRADGWPAALALLAEHHAENGEADATAAFVLSDFLDREVLARLSRAQLGVLEVCGVLGVFEPDVVREISGARHLPVTLRRLELHTQLIAQARDTKSYRTHALLTEHLVDRLKRRTPTRLREIRLAGYAAYLRRGRPERAIEFALEARDWTAAIGALDQLLEPLYQRGEWSTLATWIDQFPEEALNRRPDLILTRARLDTWMRNPHEGLLRLNRLDTRELDRDQRALRVAYQAAALRSLGRSNEAVELCQQIREASIASEPFGYGMSRVNLEEGITLGSAGHFERASERLEVALHEFERLGDPRHTLAAYKALGSAYVALGRLRPALETHRAALPLARAVGDAEYECMTLNNMCEGLRSLGDLETARATLESVIERADVQVLERIGAYARESLAEVESDLGRLDQAEALLLDARQRWVSTADYDLYANVRRMLALLYLERGQYDDMSQTCAEALGRLSPDDRPLYASWFDALLGAMWTARGRPLDALSLLDRALKITKRLGAPMDEGRIQLRRAHALLLLEDTPRCHRALREVAKIADRIGYDEFLWVDARLARPVVEYAAEREMGAVFVRLLRPVTEQNEGARAARFVARALGPFALQHAADASDVERHSERSIELLFYLLDRDGGARKEEIVAALWPEIAPARLNSAFHSTLYRLREAIGREAVLRKDGRYYLADLGAFHYDVTEYGTLIEQARARASGDLERHRLLTEAADLYRGPFADGCDSEWVEAPRRALAREQVAVLTELGRDALERSDWQAALNAATRIARVDPLDESSETLQAEAHRRMDRRTVPEADTIVSGYP